MSVRTVIVELRADIEDFRRGLEDASDLAKRQGDAMSKVGKGAIVMGAAMAAGLVVSAKAAIEWESAWAGVSKTVSGSAEQMAVLEKELRGLATTLPTTHKEIAAVAEAAGQLGVKREDITSFTKTMIDLGETTNLTADEAATSMARLANIMGTAGGDIDRLGSTLVALGNDGASTEADILQMAVRIAGAGKQIGLTEGEVLGFANAMSSVGIEAEAGGSAISRVMIDMAVAVETGGANLERFAAVAGVTTAELSAGFGQDAAGAVNMFIDGLGRMTASGQSTFMVLDELGLSEIRTRDLLLRLSNAQGLATASTQLGNEAWKANTALVEEANKRYETTSSKIQVAKNSLNELAIDLGTVLLPAIGSAVGGISDLAGFFSGLSEPVQAALVIVGALGAALSFAGSAALIIIPKILALEAGLISLGVGSWTASVAVGALGVAMKAAALAAGAAVIIGAVYLIGRSLQTAAPEVATMTENLREYADTQQLTGDVARHLGGDFESLADKLKVANNNRLSIIDGTGLNEVETARDVLANLDSTLASMVTGGNIEEAAALFGRMVAAVQAEGGSVEELTASMGGYGDALAAANREQKDTAEGAYEAAGAIGALQAPLGTIYDSLQKYAEGMQKDEEATKAMTKQVEEWGQSLADFVQPLGAYTDLIASKTEAEQADAEKSAQAQNDSVDKKEKAVRREYDIRLDGMKSNKGVSDEAVRNVEDQRDREIAALDGQKKGWEDYAGTVSVSVTEYLGELQRQVEAQEKHADNMTKLAGRVSQGTLDELARMGPEGAPLVAQLVNASDAELSKLEGLYRRRTSEATGEMAGELYLANVLLPQIASKVGQGTATALAVALANGTTTVAQIARDYGGVLAGGINPILTSLGKAEIEANAHSYADGGFEDHRAQIAPAGAWRLWAEPETGGEAYIPLAGAKRPRSLDIWRETGRRLGVDFEEFAVGGFSSPAAVPNPYSTSPFGSPISTAGDGTMQVGYQAVLAAMQAQAAATAAAVSSQAGGSGVAGRGNVDAELLRRFDAWNSSQGGRLRINSGFRSAEKQAMLYARYLAGNGPVAAPPGRSNHEKSPARAIDYGPANWGLTGTARAFGLKAPVRSEAWHLEVMARGGILNPHVRDRGGPLLPGHTFNGTGRSEMVLPMAQGGITRPVPGAMNLSSYASTMASPADLTTLLKQWDRYLEQLEQAARRTELLAAVQAGEANAMERLRDFDVTAYRKSETEAVDRLVESLEAEQQARENALDAAKDADSDARDAAESAAGALNRMLDEQETIQRKQSQSSQSYAEDRVRLTGRLVEAEADMYARQAAAAREYAEAERGILADRSSRLSGWARLDERVVMSWGNSVQELLLNARVQAEQFAGWADALAEARSRGVSEGVIEALGLDEGPEALNQLRQFSSATQAEIDALNGAVAQRTTAAATQSRSEQLTGVGQVAADLSAAHAEYTAALGEISGTFAEVQSDVQAELAVAQQEFLTEQADLTVELAAVGTEQGRSYADALAAGLSSGIPAVQSAAQALATATQEALAAQLALGAAQAHAAGMTPDAYAVSTGGQALTDRIRAIFTNRGVAIGSGTETEDQRLARIVGEVLAGRSLDSVRSSVDRLRVGSFDSGGWLQPGLTLAYNGTGTPERVQTAQQMSGSTSRTVNFMPNSTVVVQDQADMNLLLSRAEFVVQTGSM